MSLPLQVGGDKSAKQRAAAMKEPVQQHPGEVYYGMGPPPVESGHGADSTGASAVVYNPDKGPQGHSHYQQPPPPVKWMNQEALQAPGWSQEPPVSTWGQNFGPYMSGVNVRSQMAFHKGVHEAVALPMGAEGQLGGGVVPPVDAYRDAPAQGRGLEWDQHPVAAMQQAYQQHAHKGLEVQGGQGQPPHVAPHPLQGSMLQPFQATFRPSKQFSSGYYPVFPGNKGVSGLVYGEQPKSQQQQQQQQQQLIHQMQQQQQQQQQMHHQHQQQQQQQQLHQQRQLQLQQQQQQQHIQQQQQQQMQLQQQMQQQYHHQQHMQQQQHMQHMQQQQLQQHQNVTQQDGAQLQAQPKQQQQQQMQNFAAYQSPEQRPPESALLQKDPQQQQQPQEAEPHVPNPFPDKALTNPAEAAVAAGGSMAPPRRSRRLSRDGQSPPGGPPPPTTTLWPQEPKEPPSTQNGVAAAVAQAARGGGDAQVTTGGVIQVTSRRRRASKEINLETLAQQASKMEPAKMVKQEDGPLGKQATMVPLVIPVSVPVHKNQGEPQGGWAQGRPGAGERPSGQSERKPSVIVARRRSLRNSVSDSFGQDGESDAGLDEDGKSRLKRRPRPEPLIIPPPKPSTFIPPSLYPSITSYQSNLRSPVRLPDSVVVLPPYTPPPILSPVREGSGLYFSTFLTNIASNQSLPPPPPTPKSATRSLLRSSSSEVTPPVLPLITDATPVSLEPRINIGQKYQAEIPELRDQQSSQLDQHRADLVWLPMDDSRLSPGEQQRMADLMSVACSSVLRGGGTNQELVLHCLHECGGDFLDTLGRLMFQDTLFPGGHHLSAYHYSGSDCWTAEEKRYFNKGIAAYRKDFIMVQKLVQTKTVAQCVEFYYTYKKQVKIGRNGVLTFGPPDSPVEKQPEAVVDVKSSHQPKLEEDDKDVSFEKMQESSQQQARVAQSLQAHDYAGTMVMIQETKAVVSKDAQHPPQAAAHRPRAEPAAKKVKPPPPKPPQDPEAVFPCKKCGRVFYKVKSRSAHMKSHAEQEKKAAALRQKQEEEQAAFAARAKKAAAAAAATAAAAAAAVAAGGHQGGNGVTAGELSGQEDSPEGDDDDDDEDWH